MSYILDALKKAETERNLGSVPNIHAQPAFAAPPVERSSFRRTPWLWIVLPALAVVLLALALLKPRQAPPSVAMSPPSDQAPVIAKEPPQAPAAPVQEADDPEPPAVAPKKKPRAKKTAEKKPAPTAASAGAKTDAPAAGEARIVALNELPADIRKEIPTLNVNGYLYSKNQADRTVLIDHKLRQEGDQVAPDLVLEKLLPDGMVLNYKGHRYRAAY